MLNFRYMVLLNSDKRHYLQLKVQVLKNIACFLHAEEQKALRRAEQAKREREQRLRAQHEAEEDAALAAAAIEAQEDLSGSVASTGGVYYIYVKRPTKNSRPAFNIFRMNKLGF